MTKSYEKEKQTTIEAMALMKIENRLLKVKNTQQKTDNSILVIVFPMSKDSIFLQGWDKSYTDTKMSIAYARKASFKKGQDQALAKAGIPFEFKLFNEHHPGSPLKVDEEPSISNPVDQAKEVAPKGNEAEDEDQVKT